MQKKAQAARANGQPAPRPGAGVAGGLLHTQPSVARVDGVPLGGPAVASIRPPASAATMVPNARDDRPLLPHAPSQCLGTAPSLESSGAVGSTSNTSSIASTVRTTRLATPAPLRQWSPLRALYTRCGHEQVHAESFEAFCVPVGDSPLRCTAGLPEQLISQGESSLQRNLEVVFTHTHLTIELPPRASAPFPPVFARYRR